MRSLIESFRRRLGGGVPARAVASRKLSAQINVADLLGRPTVNLDSPELQRFLAGKRVLVSGAGGSIGSEICRQTMKFCPQRLILLERAENSLFEIDRELRHRWVGADIQPFVADIGDVPRIAQVFASERPQVVFHCAAHKHVPMMEINVGEAIKNNVVGTKTLADAAMAAGVAAFVMISTDKAVNPSSVMGATKRLAEMYVQSLSQCAAEPGGRATCPRFVAVRFGNVLGSNGSVVPIFQKQIEAGGPVTVTHPDMRRYFMTIAEASQLVMQAGAIGNGGEIFVLDMGQPIRILDLAREMIRRNGFEPETDIAIEFTGMRPGEKLFEELARRQEETRPTSHPRIRIWQLEPADPTALEHAIAALEEAARGSAEMAIGALQRHVPEYRPARDPADATPTTPTLRLVGGDSLTAATEAA